MAKSWVIVIVVPLLIVGSIGGFLIWKQRSGENAPRQDNPSHQQDTQSPMDITRRKPPMDPDEPEKALRNKADAREQANRLKCAVNLRQIGQKSQEYFANRKIFPPDMGMLAMEGTLNPDVFVCPNSGKIVPLGLDPQELSRWVIVNSDYVFVGGDLSLDNPNKKVLILAYEKGDNHRGESVSVLFLDGHVEQFSFPGFEKVKQRDLQIRRNMVANVK